MEGSWSAGADDQSLEAGDVTHIQASVPIAVDAGGDVVVTEAAGLGLPGLLYVAIEMTLHGRPTLGAACGAGHPVRAFRERVGCTPGELVRLRSAARLAAGCDELIAQVALGAGFADQAHRTRALGQYGVTPRVSRARYRG